MHLVTDQVICPGLSTGIYITTSKSMLRRTLATMPSMAANATENPVLLELIDSKTHPYARFALLQLNRPKAKNALSKALIQTLAGHIASIRDNDRIRGVILASSFPNVFCAGADLVERRTMAPTEVDAFLLSMRKAFRSLEQLPLPTIACIDGHALGGGLEIALCTDIRLVGTNAKLALPETRLGILPGAGGTQRMTRLIGASRTKDLVFSARTIDHTQAVSLGVALSTHADPVAAGIDLLEQYVRNSPVGIRNAKRAIDYAADRSIEAGLDHERSCYEDCMDKADRQEGLLAFKEKRKPVYGLPKDFAKAKL